MAGFIDKRKRSREDDVSCVDTPLSKRINNLHLSNYEDVAAQYNPHLTNNIIHNNNHLPYNNVAKDPMSVIKPDAGCGEVSDDIYDPELNETQNPFYYVKNKLLHDLHLERLKRCV
ncbi:uncharacterized protein LOC142230366 [Haematobia irritans]|uniref:Putative histone-lysine n-methyltransferase set1 n=1 Tax=Haematobia irritans TaxID=7368 RepID=A0A1L8EBA1_HAEIR